MASRSRLRATVHMHPDDGMALLSMSLCGSEIGYLSTTGELDLAAAKELRANLDKTIAEMEARAASRTNFGGGL
jgi:hypothetical protein